MWYYVIYHVKPFYISCTSFLLLQDGSDINTIAQEISDPEPKIITIGSLERPKEVYIVAEELVVAKLTVDNSPAALLSSFYVMNIKFPQGLTNFYTILEILFLNQFPKRIPIVVSQVISLLKQ